MGVTVKKMSPSILMLISLYSPNGTYDASSDLVGISIDAEFDAPAP